MARWFYRRGYQHRDQCVPGRRERLWVDQGGDSLWSIRMAAIHDYHSPDYQACLQERWPDKDFQVNKFFDLCRYAYLNSGIGFPWISQPTVTLQNITHVAIVF